jgi:hypothetical protein
MTSTDRVAIPASERGHVKSRAATEGDEKYRLATARTAAAIGFLSPRMCLSIMELIRA